MMKILLSFTFIVLNSSSAQHLSIPKNAIEGANFHTALVNNMEATIRTKAPKDIAEYTLSIVDACEQVCEPSDKKCLRDIHKAVIFGAINFNSFSDTLQKSGPMEVLHSLTPKDMHSNMKDLLDSSVDHIVRIDVSNVDEAVSKIEELRETLTREQFRYDQGHVDMVYGTTSIAIESSKQWNEIGLNTESGFYNLYMDMMCLEDEEKKALTLKYGEENKRLGGNSRKLQVLETILLPVIIALIPLFDIFGFVVGAAAVSNVDFLAIFTTSGYFSVFGAFQCGIDLFNCIRAIGEWFNGDFTRTAEDDSV